MAETLNPLNESAILYFTELGHKIAAVSCDSQEPSFLIQCIFVIIQQFNSILLHNIVSLVTRSDLTTAALLSDFNFSF